MGKKLIAKGEPFNPATGIDDVEGLREELDRLAENSGGGGSVPSDVDERLSAVESDVRAVKVSQSAQSVRIESLDNTKASKTELSSVTARVATLESGKLDKSEKGANGGVATLNESGKIPSSQLPSYVDDVIDDYTYAQFPATGETGKIYIAKDTNKTYRWSGSGYAEISASLALGETSATAYAGNKGKQNADNIAKLQSDLQETHQLASNAESAISEVVERTIPAIENEVAKKATKSEAQGYATTAKNEAIAASATDAQNKANTAESNANDYTDSAVDDLAKGQVATNKANIASLQTAQTSLSATVKTNTNNITTHTQQITNLSNNKLDKTEKAADSEKLGGSPASDYIKKEGGTLTGNLTAPSFIGDLQGNLTTPSQANQPTRKTKITPTGVSLYASDNSGWSNSISIYKGGGESLGSLAGAYGEMDSLYYYYYGGTYDNPIIKVYTGGAVEMKNNLTAKGNIKASGNVSANDGNFSGALTVGGNATITGTMSAITTYHSSDERLKTFEGDVEVDWEKLKALPKKYFHWTADADGKRQLGTSAQAVREVFPELVSEDSDGYLSVNYANLSVVALAAIDKLAEQNAQLEERLARIEKLLNIE